MGERQKDRPSYLLRFLSTSLVALASNSLEQKKKKKRERQMRVKTELLLQRLAPGPDAGAEGWEPGVLTNLRSCSPDCEQAARQAAAPRPTPGRSLTPPGPRSSAARAPPGPPRRGRGLGDTRSRRRHHSLSRALRQRPRLLPPGGRPPPPAPLTSYV